MRDFFFPFENTERQWWSSSTVEGRISALAVAIRHANLCCENVNQWLAQRWRCICFGYCYLSISPLVRCCHRPPDKECLCLLSETNNRGKLRWSDLLSHNLSSWRRCALSRNAPPSDPDVLGDRFPTGRLAKKLSPLCSCEQQTLTLLKKGNRHRNGLLWINTEVHMWMEGCRGVCSFLQMQTRCPLWEPVWRLCLRLFQYETSPRCCSRGNNGNREKRQLAHLCLENFPEKESLLKTVLDLNWEGKKKTWWTGLQKRKWGQRGRSADIRRERKEGEGARGPGRPEQDRDMRKSNNNNIRNENDFVTINHDDSIDSVLWLSEVILPTAHQANT